jgi:hypothetical protein
MIVVDVEMIVTWPPWGHMSFEAVVRTEAGIRNNDSATRVERPAAIG